LSLNFPIILFCRNVGCNDLEQIPDVAIRLNNITYTPVIGRDNDNYLIAPEDVP
jgi:hypothetical protein